ncbi:MAG: hypothetical protein CMC57_02330 [Flavobacteriaceae bacterium]|nr:hypothetical protein [Flavobacteriaceae bacterium]
MIDLIIVLSYFFLIFFIAVSKGYNKNLSADEYFLSSRKLKWPSIALSTIATNVNGYQFLGMMGSAYLYGLAQANLEINAVQGLLIAAFIFVPFFIRERVVTITQFIKKKLGERIAHFYSIANISLFSTITLGAALFWGAYAAEMVFKDHLMFLHENRIIRIAILILLLGLFSAVYTYLGGLSAVVRTDVIQFIILLLGGLIVLIVSISHLGGWSELYEQTSEKMHLHLPADHEKLPWTHLLGLFFLNINYWCANQTVLQRSLAADNLYHAQTGLMVGGLLKYVMAIIIVIPGIALYGIVGDSLPEPDMAFPYLIQNYIGTGLKGIILCALFASLMSTVDSTFNSLATLWSVDIYSSYINKKATDYQKVNAGRKAIIFSFFTAVLMGFILLYLKFENPGAAFTHDLNEFRYYINCAIVIIICSSILFLFPNRKGILIAFLMCIPINIFFKNFIPDMNYFVRAFWVIIIGLAIAIISSRGKINSINSLFYFNSKRERNLAIFLVLSLLLVHLVFH